jgi:hypothetical protein
MSNCKCCNKTGDYNIFGYVLCEQCFLNFLLPDKYIKKQAIKVYTQEDISDGTRDEMYITKAYYRPDLTDGEGYFVYGILSESGEHLILGFYDEEEMAAYWVAGINTAIENGRNGYELGANISNTQLNMLLGGELL